ncbi:phytanoyl-CoA dioxygenase family protein [Azohydromonas aeria]|uniref:phytanoyl-CoA dioxygenase family protein n=1 Tax=Azohydromonas aeria TaxID=2590212 RepID=UPI0012F766EC|nr:phytanoyl-CoA dioxygenase family protein [Azohydromonas aeria]
MDTPSAGAAPQPPQPDYDTARIMGGLYGDGIIALRGAFEPAWADRLREDIEQLFEEARQRPRGALPRGPQRWYVEVHPERLRGFVDIVTHPWFKAVCRAVLGPDYRIVEVGFDVPLPGAQDQPWHRDFPMPPETSLGRRLNSLAFNLTAVDTTPEMGPFEVAPGTQWDEFGLDAEDSGRREAGMFPPREWFPRYEARRQVRMAQRGDISARSALTIHRGTAHRGDRARPVLVVGVDAPDARNGERHDIQVTPGYLATLPAEVRTHLAGRVVEKLEYIEQSHGIEGLLAPGSGSGY